MLKSKDVQEARLKLQTVPLDEFQSTLAEMFPILPADLGKVAWIPVLERFKKGERGNLLRMVEFLDQHCCLSDYFDLEAKNILSSLKLNEFLELMKHQPCWGKRAYPNSRLYAFDLLTNKAQEASTEDLEQLVRIRKEKIVKWDRNFNSNDHDGLIKILNVHALWVERSINHTSFKKALKNLQYWVDKANSSPFQSSREKTFRVWKSIVYLDANAPVENLTEVFNFFAKNKLNFKNELFTSIIPGVVNQGEEFKKIHRLHQAVKNSAMNDDDKKIGYENLWSLANQMVRDLPDEKKKDAGFSIIRMWDLYSEIDWMKKNHFPITKIILEQWAGVKEVKELLEVVPEAMHWESVLYDMNMETWDVLLNRSITPLYEPLDFDDQKKLVVSLAECSPLEQSGMNEVDEKWCREQINQWATSPLNTLKALGKINVIHEQDSLNTRMPANFRVWLNEKSPYSLWVGKGILDAVFLNSNNDMVFLLKSIYQRFKKTMNPSFYQHIQEIMGEKDQSLFSPLEKQDLLEQMSFVEKWDWNAGYGMCDFEKSVWYTKYILLTEEEKAKKLVDKPILKQMVEAYEMEVELKKDLIKSKKIRLPLDTVRF